MGTCVGGNLRNQPNETNLNNNTDIKHQEKDKNAEIAANSTQVGSN